MFFPAVKDPNEVKDYALDWYAMVAPDDDSIINSSWTVESGEGLVIDSSSYTSTLTTVWLSAGESGVTYELINRVTTEGGRTYDQSVKLRCRKK